MLLNQLQSVVASVAEKGRAGLSAAAVAGVSDDADDDCCLKAAIAIDDVKRVGAYHRLRDS